MAGVINEMSPKPAPAFLLGLIICTAHCPAWEASPTHPSPLASLYSTFYYPGSVKCFTFCLPKQG